MLTQKETVKMVLNTCLKIIKLYEWLLDLYVLDFFIDNHWDKLPKSWRDSFHNVDPQDIAKVLSAAPTKHVIPLSLLALMKSVNTLAIPRIGSCSTVSGKGDSDEGVLNLKQKFNNLFLKHVKLKKRHEINLMAQIVLNTAQTSQCNAVLDFGSGLGHLVRMLAYKGNLFTAGIECQAQLTEEARKLDFELEYTAKKYLSESIVSGLHRPIHYNITLSSPAQLSRLELPSAMDSYGLVGLHPCGDLGPLLLKHFVNCKDVKFICVVGCCYMKLSCDTECKGYPMSEYVNSLEHKLSYASREIACHAIDVYCERLQNGNYEDLKIHAYRAALERILVEHDPKLRHTLVRSIKHSDKLTFQSYCSLALERLDISVPMGPLTWSRGIEDLKQWRRVVMVYTLRLLLAPIVETVILLDRVLYVLEHGLSCKIYPVFDPKISPRNHIIIGRRI